MAEILGVDIGAQHTGAVRLGGDASMSPLALGESGPTTATAIGRGPDGSTLVGDAAARGSDDVVTDPIEQAVAGDGAALTALVGHVIGRAVAATGTPPDRLALVIPDDLVADARGRVVGAAIAGGIADVVVVPRSVAEAQQPPSAGSDRPAELMLAAGAALAVHREPPPIVTREEIGGSAPVVTPVVPAADPPTGTVSVFDVEETPPATPPVRPVAETPSSTPAPVPAAAAPTMSIPAVAPRQREMIQPPDRRVPLWIVLSFAAVLTALLVTVALVVLAGGDDEGDVATDGSTTTTAESSTSTTPASSSSTSSTPTSTSTSTSTSSTTSSTTTSSSTTTLPVPVGTPGPVTLVETGLQLDTGTVLRFEQDGEVIVDEISAVLGEPDDDSGWEVRDFCEGLRNRFVRWGQLEIVLEEIAEGVSRFGQWHAEGATDPVGLVTVDGLGVGATVGFLEVNYASTLQLGVATEGNDIGLFGVTNPGSDGVLLGLTTGLDPEDEVTEVWAGDTCPRIFV